MKQTLPLMAAPTAMQPGGYVPVAYVNRQQPMTLEADIEVAYKPGYWRISLRWACAAPVTDIRNETDKFADACALMVPVTNSSPWITMGEPGKPVEALLWRADKERQWKLRAEGLGTMEREQAPESWKSKAHWNDGYWQVDFTITGWQALDEYGMVGIAIWQGSAQDRGGLKSISQGWIRLVE